MAQAILETLLYREYLNRGDRPQEAMEKAREAATSYKAQTGLSEEEIVAGMRQQQEAEDWKSLASQVLTKSPVLSETPRRASTQRVLGASALTSSLNPEIRGIGEEALRNRMPDPAIRAAMEKSVADQGRAQRDALYQEKMKRGAVSLSPNASPEAVAHFASVRRPYDVSHVLADRDRAEAEAKNERDATVREALGLQEGAALPAGGQSYRYDVPVSSRPFQPAADEAKDILRARLAVPVPGSIPAPEGTDVSQFGAMDYMQPTRATVGSAPSALPMMARSGSSNIMGYGGGEYTPGTSADRVGLLMFPSRAPDVSAAPAPRAAVSVSRPTPTTRPSAEPAASAPREAASPSFFSSLGSAFKDPYAGMSSRQLYEKAQEAQNQNDEARANLLNIRAAREAAPSAEKRGGAVNSKPHKDAALHKALDIIHAMMVQHRR